MLFVSNNNKKIIGVDLFCGAGGLTRGLKDAGIQVKRGFDIDEKLKVTYEKNNGRTKFVCKDVSKITGDEVLKGIDREKYLFLLAGCAPCQPFSRINKSNFEEDGRKLLLMQFARLIEETNPDFIMLENVPGLMRGRGKFIFDKFIEQLESQKYNYDADVLNAKNYGVPQNRERVILLASRHGKIKIPEATHGKNKKPYVTVRDILSKYPAIKSGSEHPKIPNHQTRALEDINKERLQYVKKNGGSRFDFPDHLVLECHKKHNGHSDVYGRMRWDDVSPTLTCKCTSISNGRFGHPTQLRGISVREAAALQTFKDNYTFYGSITDTSRWVGNAVPVIFSKALAESIKEKNVCH